MTGNENFREINLGSHSNYARSMCRRAPVEKKLYTVISLYNKEIYNTLKFTDNTINCYNSITSAIIIIIMTNSARGWIVVAIFRLYDEESKIAKFY